MNSKIKKCNWFFYTDYYETDCGQDLTEFEFENIDATFCPYCGNKINK